MKFSNSFCLGLVLLVVVAFDFSASAPRKYEFVPAKCVIHPTDKDIGGPLSICTFPPKYTAVSQEDIDAVIEHIQTLNLS